MKAVPGTARLASGMMAVSAVELMKAVGSGVAVPLAFQRTTAPLAKKEPVTVNCVDGLPEGSVAGCKPFAEAIFTWLGTLIVKVEALDAPPPGSITVRNAEPWADSKVSGIWTDSCVGFRKIGVRVCGEPVAFH